jgi:nucleotide-binding universal stress UspA family protein
MTVVVGYVPTETGFLAVTTAEREARALDVPVVIVNVVGYSGYTVPTAADERDLEAVGAYLTAHGVRNSLRHFDQVESEESVPEIILDVAREEHATLIVLGLHQRPLIKKRLLGSTAESIVLAASCPVLIVPDVDEPDARP